MKIRKLPPDFTGRFNCRRFLFAADKRGLNTGSKLAAAINVYRTAIGDAPISRVVSHRWLTGEATPTRAGNGRVAGIFELALVLRVSVDWLLGCSWEPSALTRGALVWDDGRESAVAYEDGNWVAKIGTRKAVGLAASQEAAKAWALEALDRLRREVSP